MLSGVWKGVSSIWVFAGQWCDAVLRLWRVGTGWVMQVDANFSLYLVERVNWRVERQKIPRLARCVDRNGHLRSVVEGLCVAQPGTVLREWGLERKDPNPDPTPGGPSEPPGRCCR